MQETSNEELVGDQVRVLVTKKEGCEVEFDVFASKGLIAKARLDAVKQVAKEVTLPGFRKGKAPNDVVLKNYPADVERKFHKSLADLAFIEAQNLAKIPVLNQSSTVRFDMKSFEEEGAKLHYMFETEPVAQVVDPTLFTPKPVEKKEVGETEINEAIRQMAFFYAKWEPVQDRPIEEGDFIVIDLDTLEGEETNRVFDQVRFEVKKERMAQWMRELVANAKAGDVLEGTSRPDDTASLDEKKEFAPKKVRLHVRVVEKASLPKMDDEFAKKIGAPDVAGMNTLVEGVLKKQVEDKANQDLREQVNHFLVTTYEFDIPKSLVQEEFKHRLNGAMKNSEFQAHMAKASPEEKEKIEARMKDETTHSLRLFYLSRQIVQEGKIPVTNEEINHRAVEQRKMHPAARNLGNEISREEYALALSTVFLSKAQDFILKRAIPDVDSSGES